MAPLKREEPYNPLDKKHLAESTAKALLNQPVVPLPPPEAFEGAGIYALYYLGDFPAYAPMAEANLKNRFARPIYVGKADPKGGGKGGGGLDTPSGTTSQPPPSHGTRRDVTITSNRSDRL
ncbi:MAG TPA: Eco29kI family restriction endonuclease [Rhodospirillales bacterium]|nr:Eco29kI family restriction endonuclease [Rhodospirillales bacterium]